MNFFVFYFDFLRKDFKLIILDSGEEECQINIFVNNSVIENNINCDFFFPVYDNRKVFIAGSGSQCCIQSFECNCMIKPKFGKQYSSLNKNNKYLNKDDCCYLL